MSWTKYLGKKGCAEYQVWRDSSPLIRAGRRRDRPGSAYLAQRWITYRRRSADGDLFLGPYPALIAALHRNGRRKGRAAPGQESTNWSPRAAPFKTQATAGSLIDCVRVRGRINELVVEDHQSGGGRGWVLAPLVVEQSPYNLDDRLSPAWMSLGERRSVKASPGASRRRSYRRSQRRAAIWAGDDKNAGDGGQGADRRNGLDVKARQHVVALGAPH